MTTLPARPYCARMRRLIQFVSASLATMLLTACVAPPQAPTISSPPAAAAPTATAPTGLGAPDRSELEAEAASTWQLYLEVVGAAWRAPETTVRMFETVAGPNHAFNMAHYINRQRFEGSIIEGLPVSESFDLLRGVDGIIAHVCSNTSEMREVDVASGATASLEDPDLYREVLVVFARDDAGSLRVELWSPVEAHERTCP